MEFDTKRAPAVLMG